MPPPPIPPPPPSPPPPLLLKLLLGIILIRRIHLRQKHHVVVAALGHRILRDSLPLGQPPRLHRRLGPVVSGVSGRVPTDPRFSTRVDLPVVDVLGPGDAGLRSVVDEDELPVPVPVPGCASLRKLSRREPLNIRRRRNKRASRKLLPLCASLPLARRGHKLQGRGVREERVRVGGLRDKRDVVVALAVLLPPLAAVSESVAWAGAGFPTLAAEVAELVAAAAAVVGASVSV